jgi:putative membrane protein
MKTASALFSAEERRKIGAAVSQAEKRTAGEILPVVATVSGRYDRAEDLFGLLLSVITLSVAWILSQGAGGGDWTTGDSTPFSLVAVIAILLGVFVVGTALAARFPALRLVLIPRREMLEEVERRALEVFQRHRLRTTAGATGVLIYVSLYEHMVRVVGDDAIAAKVSQQDWEEVCAVAVDAMKRGHHAQGLEQAVRLSGELLALNFPIQPGDRNELSNDLVLID